MITMTFFLLVFVMTFFFLVGYLWPFR